MQLLKGQGGAKYWTGHAEQGDKVDRQGNGAKGRPDNLVLSRLVPLSVSEDCLKSIPTEYLIEVMFSKGSSALRKLPDP
jgi:hypothetical protein